MTAASVHEMPFGARVLSGGGARFAIWAPAARRVELCLEGEPRSPLPLQSQDGGWFRLDVADIGAGTRYRYRIDSGLEVPDPASRFQPDDVQGPSMLVDPASFAWSDAGWKGRPWRDTVIYELHVGTFTREGTYEAVAAKFDHLIELGVTAIELMPLAEVPGRRNWGYDGVLLFAPESAYGSPEGLKRLIDLAHRRGLMVFLDVVYNHFGPEGNYLSAYAPAFFTERHQTPWGAAVNFDGGARPVRDFFIHNALYWLEEFHLDGLRFDAVHAIIDDSRPHILTELAETVRERLSGRHIHLVLENDHNQAGYLERASADARHPRWYTAQWNDDLHHALHVATTRESGGYYEDYCDRPMVHLGRALAEGFAYQGEYSRHREGAARGTVSRHLPPTAFVSFLQNHDQIGNRAFGERSAELLPAERLRAATAILLLAPSPPLLFMGEEWGSRQPFPFFCDFHDELADKVREGRRREFAHFPEFRDPAARARIPDPNAQATFDSAVLDWRAPDSSEGRAWLSFYRRLLEIRACEIAPRLPKIGGEAGDYIAVGDGGMRVCWRCDDGDELYLFANLGDGVLAHGMAIPDGEVLIVVGGEEAAVSSGTWPAWFVAWMIRRAGNS